MWAFTKRAFMSAVVYDPTKDRSKDPYFRSLTRKFGTHILVRARVKEDLEDLRPACKNLHIATESIADYKFRTVISRRQWKKYLNRAVDEMDYDSHFKEVVERNSFPESLRTARHSAMMSCWTAMNSLTYKSGSGYSSGTGYGSYSGTGNYGSGAGSYSANNKPSTTTSKYQYTGNAPVASPDKAWPKLPSNEEAQDDHFAGTPAFSEVDDEWWVTQQHITPEALIKKLVDSGSIGALDYADVLGLNDEAYEVYKRFKAVYGDTSQLTETMVMDFMADLEQEGWLLSAYTDEETTKS